MNGQAIGIDVGGTKILAGVVEQATGRIQGSSSVPTPVSSGGKAVLAACVELVRALDPDAGLPVGVAVPELVSCDGTIQSAHVFDWREINVQSAFIPRGVAIASDVRAAASAESTFGAGAGATSMLYVTIGTGISSTFVLNGTPWPGARGNALVLASGDLASIDSRTGAVVWSVLEEWAAGPALVARYVALGGQAGITTGQVLDLAASGDAKASCVVNGAADALGSAIGQAVNILDPGLVVIGGGLGLAGGPWWHRIVASARHSIWSEQTRPLPIVPARLGVESGMVGAALAVKNTGRC